MKTFQVYTPLFLAKIVALSLILTGCNPVKQVLKDNSKFNIVAEEVIRRGYCVTDTVVETKIDTLYQSDSSVVNTISAYKEIDTIFTDGSSLRIDSAGNLSFGCPVKIQYKTITKTETVRDRSLETILKKDIAVLDSIKRDLQLDVKQRDLVIKETEQKLKQAQRKFKGFITILILVVVGGAYLKVRKFLPF
jgi:predicted small secreted protein